MDRCVQTLEKKLSYEFYWQKSLDMKSMQCKPSSIPFTTATENADLMPLVITKKPYFTHRAIWQTPSREAAEHYLVLSIIHIH